MMQWWVVPALVLVVLLLFVAGMSANFGRPGLRASKRQLLFGVIKGAFAFWLYLGPVVLSWDTEEGP